MDIRFLGTTCGALIAATLIATAAFGAQEGISAKLAVIADEDHLTFRFDVTNRTNSPVCFEYDNFSFDRATFYDRAHAEISNNFTGGYPVTVGMMVQLIAVPPDGESHLHSEDSNGQSIFGNSDTVSRLAAVRYELIGYNCEDLMRDTASPRIVFRQTLEETVQKYRCEP